jgi:hypothetical protein
MEGLINKDEKTCEIDGLAKDHLASVSVKIIDWLNEMEEICGSSANLNSALSGKLKMLINNVKKASGILSMGAGVTEDPEDWKLKYEDLKIRKEELQVKTETLEKVTNLYRNKRNGSEAPTVTSELPFLLADDDGSFVSMDYDGDPYFSDEEVDGLTARRSR